MGIQIGADVKLDKSDLRREAKRGGDIVEREFKQAFRAVGRVASATFNGMGKSVRALISTKGLIVGLLAGVGLDKFVKGSAALDVQQKALANQLGVTQRRVAAYISAVNNASAGLLDFQTAATLANRALVLGVPQSSIAQLVEYVSIISTATNEADQAEERIKALLTAVATGRTASLVQFGIMLDTKALDGLAPAAKQAEVLKQVIDQLGAKTRALGVSAREPFFVYTGIFGNIKDIINGLGLAIIKSDQFGKKVDEISRATGNIAELFRSGEFGEVFGAVAFSAGELLKAALKDAGSIFSKVLLHGIATAVDVLGSIDFSGLTGRLVASIADSIRQAFPGLAAAFGITEESVAAARNQATDGKSIADQIRAMAESVDATNNLRDALERINERFGTETRQNPTAPGSTIGDELGGPIPTNITRAQFEESRRRLAAGAGPRVQRFIDALSRDQSGLTEGRFSIDAQAGESDKDRRRRLFQGGINPDTGKPIPGGPAALRRRFGVSEDDDSFPRSDAIAKARQFADLEQERDQLIVKQFRGKLTDADRERIGTLNEQLSPTRPTITQRPGEVRDFKADSPAAALKLLLEGLGIGESTIKPPAAEEVGTVVSEVAAQQAQRDAQPREQREAEIRARDAELRKQALQQLNSDRQNAAREAREREVAAQEARLRRMGFNELADTGTVDSTAGQQMKAIEENRQRLEAKEAAVKAENEQRAMEAAEAAEKAQQQLDAARQLNELMSMLAEEAKRMVGTFRNINGSARDAANSLNA